MISYEEIYIKLFEKIHNKSEYLYPYLDRQASCEKWLQAEFIHFLYEQINDGAITSAELEKIYGPRKGFCDIWFKMKDMEIWCELQVIVTNYSGPGKPITNQVKHVIDDAFKLEKCPVKSAKKHLLFLAYPFSQNGSNDSIWKVKHLSRIAEVSRLLMETYTFPLKGGYEARFYLAKPLSNE